MPDQALSFSTDQASRPSSNLARFHVPFEHGAWWSFFSTLVGAALVAWAQGADRWAWVGLTVCLTAGFVTQDWAQALLAALLRRRSQAVSQWRAWQGWVLALLALGGAGLMVARVDVAQRVVWGGLLAVGALATAAALTTRIFQSGRGRKSLAVTALLLAAPALFFGCLTFGFSAQALAFWVWPLAFYPAATLSAQSFIRGFPQRARWAGPGMMAGLAGLAAGCAAWLGAGILLVLAMRLDRSIRARWSLNPTGLPTGPEIRAFGKEQAFFGVLLTIIWAYTFGSH